MRLPPLSSLWLRLRGRRDRSRPFFLSWGGGSTYRRWLLASALAGLIFSALIGWAMRSG